jgi:hypothetical protein
MQAKQRGTKTPAYDLRNVDESSNFFLTLVIFTTMPITLIREAPDVNSFTPLAEFQERTPESLTDIEVLHYSAQVQCEFTPPTASPFRSPLVTSYVTSKYGPLMLSQL